MSFSQFSPARIAILISGSGSNMVSLVKAMSADIPAATPCLVLSNKADALGLEKAQKLGVQTACVAHKDYPKDRAGFEQALHHELMQAKPDIICLAGFMRVLSGDFVSKWDEKILNIHPSLLPKYKGLDTHQRALEAGDSHHGCTVHEVTAQLDDGPILGQARVPILKGDTPEHLAQRVQVQEHLLYPRVLSQIVAGHKDEITLNPIRFDAQGE